MKISILLPSLHGGGAERSMINLATWLVGKGYNIDFVLLRACGEYLKDVPSGVRVVDLDRHRLWTSLPAFVRYLRQQRPDVVLSAMPLANGIAVWGRFFSRVRTRIVLSEHNPRSLTMGGVKIPKKYWVLQWAIRFAYRYADAIVAVSEGVAERVRTLPGVQPECVHTIYNPVFTSEIVQRANEPLPHPWFKDTTVPTVVSAGRLVKAKDFATLIRAINKIRSIKPMRLIILGEGEERPELERLIRLLNLNAYVDLPGFVSNPWAYMKRASVFVLSSIHEGFGNVLVEAMACGTPVVATDCESGPREIVDSGRFGTLVPVGDVDALADAIVRTVNAPIERAKLIARAKEFSIQKAAEKYISVLLPQESVG